VRPVRIGAQLSDPWAFFSTKGGGQSWHRFALCQILSDSVHPELRSEPRMGENTQQRFLPLSLGVRFCAPDAWDEPYTAPAFPTLTPLFPQPTGTQTAAGFDPGNVRPRESLSLGQEGAAMSLGRRQKAEEPPWVSYRLLEQAGFDPSELVEKHCPGQSQAAGWACRTLGGIYFSSESLCRATLAQFPLLAPH